MPIRSWNTYLARLLAAFLAVLLLAWISGWWLPVLGLALVAYSGWQVYNSWRLHRWLQDPRQDPPESLGAWADIFDQINLLQKQNRRHWEQQNATIEEFMRVSDAFPDASLVIDGQANITWFNEAAGKLLALRSPADLGQPITNLLREPDFADWLAVQDKVSSKLEMGSPHNQNVHLLVSAVRYSEGQRLLILRDVTDIHNLERIRRDFVANVSHELRTPLTVLLGYLESIQEQCPKDLQPAVERMRGQAQHMYALLKDLLELSRLQSDEHASPDEDVDVPAMLAQLRELADELSRGTHEIRFEVHAGLKLRGVAVDLESAFRNLIQNAVHYTPQGGRITVQWTDTEQGPQLSVEDSGPGIPKKDIPRLTERFYRVGSDRSRKGGGTGLGLSIVKHVLNAHQARLVIQSELGAGSSFRCVFPRERAVLNS
jgi:two-component system phosphate regulon sensor histidine kinase PhoR